MHFILYRVWHTILEGVKTEGVVVKMLDLKGPIGEESLKREGNDRASTARRGAASYKLIKDKG